VTALALDIVIPPDWGKIDPAREAVGLLVLAVSGDGDIRDAVAMVSEELLENAIKYSTPGTSVGLTLRDDGAGVLVAVTNTVEEGSAHLPKLCERIDWIRTFPTAAAAYQAAIERVYLMTEGGESGLGIARAAYEGRCELSCDLSVPGRVTVSAARAWRA